jgi:hypothetical protein
MKIKRILMQRDGMSSEEADELIAEAKAELKNRLENGDIFELDAEICEEFFGLEPDYIFELL